MNTQFFAKSNYTKTLLILCLVGIAWVIGACGRKSNTQGDDPALSFAAAKSQPSVEQALPEGFARISIQTDRGPVTVTFPRRKYRFQPSKRTYYLAPNGSDNGDGSKSRPWATFGRALSALKPGDLLYVREGDYKGPIMTRIAGKPNIPIIISAYPGERARLVTDPPAPGVTQDQIPSVFQLKESRYVWIHGLEIVGSRGMLSPDYNRPRRQSGISLANGAGEGVRLLNNTISRCLANGIKEEGHGGRRFVVEGNVLFDNGTHRFQDHGMYIPASETVIRGNAVFRNAAWGIHQYDGNLTATKNQIYNNVVFENKQDGILVSGDYSIIAHNVSIRNGQGAMKLYHQCANFNIIVNNIFMDGDAYQIGASTPQENKSAPSSNHIDYNVVFAQSRRKLYENSVVTSQTGDHMQSQDPQMINAASNDFRLKSTSPVQGKVEPVQLNGAKNWPDPGIFPATQYEDPEW